MYIIKAAIKNLMRKKLRSTLIMLSIAIGITSVLTISSIGDLGTVYITDMLYRAGLNSVIVMPEDGFNGRVSEEVYEYISGVPYVSESTAVIMGYGVLNYNNQNHDTAIFGVDESSDEFVNFEFLHGEYFNSFQLETAESVCIIDENLAVLLFGRKNVIGKEVKISTDEIIANYKITGVVTVSENPLTSMFAGFMPNLIYIPNNALGTEGYTQLAIRMSDDKYSSTELLQDVVNERFDDQDIMFENLSSHIEILEDILYMVTLLLAAVGAISFIVSCIGIMIIMMVSVNERVREIGIKKSLGATKFIIIKEFIAESATITFLGGLLGCFVSQFIITVISVIIGEGIYFNITLMLSILFVSVLFGTFFGIYPAIMAANQDAVDALRN